MKKEVLTESTYDIPYNRWVDLELAYYDPSKEILVQIKHPKGFEDDIHHAIIRRNGPAVALHKRIAGKMLRPTRVDLLVYQEIETEEEAQPEPEAGEVALNPKTEALEKEKNNFVQSIVPDPLKPANWKQAAIEKAQRRKDRLTKLRGEVNEATPLKPMGLDGRRILTADDCDYSRGYGQIFIFKELEAKHNAQAGLDSPTQQKLLSEFYDVISCSGVSVVIGLYVALGSRSKGKGNLDYLANWWKTELSKIYSPTSLGELQKKGRQLVSGMTPKAIRKAPNPGLSIKHAERVIGEFFSDEFTGQPLRMKDLQCEVYQPIFFDDEQTRCYSIKETPTARLVDVVLNTGLDPLYFQSRKAEGIGLTLGPTRRSFDLPFAQFNKGITLVSVGSELTYQESEEGMTGMNPAQLAFLNKKKSHRLDYMDAQKYLKDHSGDVSFLRVELGHLYGVGANSIALGDLEACRSAAERCSWWSNGNRNAITWG